MKLYSFKCTSIPKKLIKMGCKPLIITFEFFANSLNEAKQELRKYCKGYRIIGD